MSPCQISSKSVTPRKRYADFSIFQDGGRRHLAFSIFGNFNGRNAQYGQTASIRQILSKSVKPRPRYGDFSIFQDGGHCALGFSNFVNFNNRKAQEGQTALPCQISSISVIYVKTGNIALNHTS